MKYSDNDCIKALVSEHESLDSFVLIGRDDESPYFSTCSIYDGILYNHIIENNDLAFACKEFLLKNGNKIYKNLNEFRKENPNIIC